MEKGDFIKVYLADHAGFCFGVRRAVEIAEEVAKTRDRAYVDGDLVHNEQVVQDLKDLGLQSLNGKDSEGATIVTRSHGIPLDRLRNFQEKNEVIETVCPFVQAIYKRVEEANEKGFTVLLIGKPGHPEVEGILSRAKKGYCIEREEDLKNLDKNQDVMVLSQTTNRKEIFKTLENAILGVFTGQILVYNTICNATSIRQEETADLAKKVDLMLVLGGKQSSNTRKLVEVAKKHCENVIFIQSIRDLSFDGLEKINKIGITAGASTPDRVIKEAVNCMENLNNEEMNNEMMEAIDNSFTRVRRGEIVAGEVLFATDNEVMVNIGYRADGIVSKEELSSDPDVKPSELYQPGDEIQVYVMKMDDGDGNVVLSTKRVANMKVWDDMEEKYENKEKVTAHVKSVVKGGLTCDVDGLNGFIPASHVSIRFQRDLHKYVDTDMVCEIIDFDKMKRKFVLSRKNVELEELEEVRDRIYDEISEGDVIKGTVQRLTNFGAFVDIGGVDGLIHISELSWNRVKHPSEVVSPGEEVEVQVLKMDRERNRIALGLKQTTQKPWDIFTSEVKIGDVVKGKVVNLLDFGAFVRLESGVDGLLHVSQISREHVEKPADKLAIGDEIEVKVTDINNEEKKISLSIKALTEPEQEEKPKEKPKRRERKFERPVAKKPVEENNDFALSIGEILQGQKEDFPEAPLDVEGDDEKIEEQDEVKENLEEEKSDLLEEDDNADLAEESKPATEEATDADAEEE